MPNYVPLNGVKLGHLLIHRLHLSSDALHLRPYIRSDLVGSTGLFNKCWMGRVSHPPLSDKKKFN